MRFPQGRIPSGYWHVCAAGAFAAFILLAVATNLRLTRHNTRVAAAPPTAAATAAMPNHGAAVQTSPLQIAGKSARVKPAPTDMQATLVRLAEGYGKLPLSFEANEGQTDRQVKFLSRGRGYLLFLASDEAVLALHKPSAVSGQLSGNRNSRFETPQSRIANLKSPVINREALVPSVLRMKLVGANASAKVSGGDELPGKSNYFQGNDPQRWRTNVPQYARVRYEQVYPGIDLVYYGNQRQLEYDFVVAPGADPGAIKLAVAGATARAILKSDSATERFSCPSPLSTNGQLTTDHGRRSIINLQSTIGNSLTVASCCARRNWKLEIRNSPALSPQHLAPSTWWASKSAPTTSACRW